MELTAFSRLEQKVEELLNRLKALNSEKAELERRLEEKEKEVADLGQLLAVQDGERNEVRQRIEQLVQKLESF